MKEYVTVMTRKGQITVPAEVRRAMGLQVGDRIAVKVGDSGEVQIAPALSWTARTAGSVKSDIPPMTAEELRLAAEEAIAESAVERAR